MEATAGTTQRRRLLGLSVAAVGFVLATGTAVIVLSNSENSSDSPTGLCERALPGDVGSQSRTTLGVIRHWGTGLAGDFPAADAFGTAPDSAPGTWCWVYTGTAWKLYGVGEDGTSVGFPKILGSRDKPPTGPAAYR